MTVRSYLDSLATYAVLKDATVNTSLSTLKKRLNYYYSTDKVNDHFAFGSNTRYTMLPRKYDRYSDIDYMIVFENTGYQPQTYLNSLRSFVNAHYSNSEVKQSHPTIKLDLNHITFELVPAVYNIFYGYQIPAPTNNYESWLNTDPNAFNKELTNKNTQNNYLIKPLIRILKYWNANAGYVFDSYTFEKKIVNMYFYGCYNIKDYFYSAVDQIQVSYLEAKWKEIAVTKLKNTVSNVKNFEKDEMPYSAEIELKKILPEI
ncbi:nucleotidyltransferase [Rouxiella sp. T17]|uniref:SMODS domain-containing nucleotidyltransferase n=1 Tax=Rouxiella sp. T17 TaxID=3085684 RepID=UPI002FC83726